MVEKLEAENKVQQEEIERLNHREEKTIVILAANQTKIDCLTAENDKLKEEITRLERREEHIKELGKELTHAIPKIIIHVVGGLIDQIDRENCCSGSVRVIVRDYDTEGWVGEDSLPKDEYGNEYIESEW